jgi:tetraether lipid synthase
VVTVKKGLDDEELDGGVTFQPVQAAGRLEGHDPVRDRLTLTEVRRRILEQTLLFQPDDLIPVPCNPDCLARACALKPGDRVQPLTRFISPETLVPEGRNTIVVERDEALRSG